MREPSRELRDATHDVLSRWARLLDDEMTARTGGIVQTGPFRGMRLVAKEPDGIHVLNLLGSYEAELHPALERLLARPHGRIINIGAAEGYYAVGAALRQPDARVLAFEMRPEMLPALTANAAANRVLPRVEARGACTVALLAETLSEGALLIVDCEGAELDLLDPAAIPALRSADLLVELHDCFRPGLSEALLPRFSATHDIELVAMRGRDAADYPLLADMPQFHQLIALCDYRPPGMRWAVMTPKEPSP